MNRTRRQTDDMIDACMMPVQWEHFLSFTDWQFYVGDHTRRIWDTLNFNQRHALAMDALECMEKMVAYDPLLRMLEPKGES